MLKNTQVEKIKKLYEQDIGVTEISKEMNVDRNTIYKYLDIKNDQKEEVQKDPNVIKIPDKILKEAEKLVKQRTEKEITDKFWENTCTPHIQENYILKDEHQQEINSIKNEYEIQLESLKSGYINQINDFNDTIQQLNSTIKQIKNEKQYLQEYINNELDEAGRQERIKCEEQRTYLAKERINFNRYIEEQKIILNQNIAHFNEDMRIRWQALEKEESNLKQWHEKLDEQEKLLEKIKKETNKQMQELDQQRKKFKQESSQKKLSIDQSLQKLDTKIEELRWVKELTLGVIDNLRKERENTVNAVNEEITRLVPDKNTAYNMKRNMTNLIMDNQDIQQRLQIANNQMPKSNYGK